MKGNGHECQRYHALLLVHQGYSHREVEEILRVDENTVGRWMRQYHERGLGGLRNDEGWGGEHGQRELSPEQIGELTGVLGPEAMVGTKVGSGCARRDWVDLPASGVLPFFHHPLGGLHNLLCRKAIPVVKICA
jgi:hypothetical protein